MITIFSYLFTLFGKFLEYNDLKYFVSNIQSALNRPPFTILKFRLSSRSFLMTFCDITYLFS